MPKILLLAYPGMTLLDLVGPMQTWSLWPGAEKQLVWKTTDPVMTDTGAAIVPSHGFTDAYEAPDILFLPGGFASRKIIQDTEVIDFVAKRGARSGWITSVCTGALILGATAANCSGPNGTAGVAGVNGVSSSSGIASGTTSP